MALSGRRICLAVKFLGYQNQASSTLVLSDALVVRRGGLNVGSGIARCWASPQSTSAGTVNPARRPPPPAAASSAARLRPLRRLRWHPAASARGCSALRGRTSSFFEWDKADITARRSAILENGKVSAYATAAARTSWLRATPTPRARRGQCRPVQSPRADAVKGYLASKGIGAGAISTKAYGETEPQRGLKTASTASANGRTSRVRSDLLVLAPAVLRTDNRPRTATNNARAPVSQPAPSSR